MLSFFSFFFFCLFVQESINLLARSIYPVLFFSGLSETSCLLFCLFCSFFFILPLFFKSLLSSQRPRTSLFTQGFFYALSSQVSHWLCQSRLIIGGNHAISVYIIIPQIDEWCKFTTFCFLECGCHIWVS